MFSLAVLMWLSIVQHWSLLQTYGADGGGFGLLSLLLCFELQIIDPLQRHRQTRKYGFSVINWKLSLLEMSMLSDLCMQRVFFFHV